MSGGLGEARRVVKESSDPPRFVADVMLGSLARWLRILGFDTEFSPPFDDDALLSRAAAQGRTLLTADRTLASRPMARRVVLVPPADLPAQVAHVMRTCGLAAWVSPLTRCVACNARLRNLPRDRARDRVPPHILDAHETFLACPRCARTYWPGSHLHHILEQLRRWDVGYSDTPSRTPPRTLTSW